MSAALGKFFMLLKPNLNRKKGKKRKKKGEKRKKERKRGEERKEREEEGRDKCASYGLFRLSYTFVLASHIHSAGKRRKKISR